MTNELNGKSEEQTVIPEEMRIMEEVRFMNRSTVSLCLRSMHEQLVSLYDLSAMLIERSLVGDVGRIQEMAADLGEDMLDYFSLLDGNLFREYQVTVKKGVSAGDVMGLDLDKEFGVRVFPPGEKGAGNGTTISLEDVAQFYQSEIRDLSEVAKSDAGFMKLWRNLARGEH